MKRNEKAEALAFLRKLGVRPGATVYTTVTSVSRSGMSRNIRCYFPSKGEIVDITWAVAEACQFSRAIGGGGGADIRMGGCGMDMCFEVVYVLGRVMFPKGGPVTKSLRRHQEERDGQTVERDGGYLLRKRDL